MTEDWHRATYKFLCPLTKITLYISQSSIK